MVSEVSQVLQYYWPLIVMMCIWIVLFGLVLTAICYLSRDFYNIYDNCSPNEVKYRYLVRIDFELPPKAGPDASGKPPKLDLSKQTLTTRIYGEITHNEKKVVVYETSFTVKLSKSKGRGDDSVLNVTAILNRTHSLDTMAFIDMVSSANKQQAVRVLHIEIIGIDERVTYFGTIEKWIEYQTPAKTDDKPEFPLRRSKDFKGDFHEEIHVFKEVEVTEVVIIVFLSLNLLLLFNAISIHCNNERADIGAFISLVCSLAIEVAVVLTYRYAIKAYYQQSYGSQLWRCICYICLSLCVIIGVVSGIVSVFLMPGEKDGTTNGIIIGISIVLYVFFTVFLIVIAYVVKADIIISYTQLPFSGNTDIDDDETSTAVTQRDRL